MRLAGDDGEIDAFELQEILNNEFKKREKLITWSLSRTLYMADSTC